MKSERCDDSYFCVHFLADVLDVRMKCQGEGS